MNATTSPTNPTVTIADVRQAAAQEIEAIKHDVSDKEFAAAIGPKMNAFTEFLKTYESGRNRILENKDPAQGDKSAQLGKLASDMHKTMTVFVDGLRYQQQAAALAVELYKMPGETKSAPADALLDFLKQQELRTLLRQKKAAEVEAIYHQAVETGNTFMVRAIEGDPMGSLISPAIVEDGRRRHAEKAFPAQSKKLNDILRAQRAFDTVISKAMLAMGLRPTSAVGKAAA